MSKPTNRLVFSKDPKEPLTPEEVRAKLPKVGDRLRLKPTTGDKEECHSEMWCTVVYVNLENLYYTVKFQEKTTRFKESYKVF